MIKHKILTTALVAVGLFASLEYKSVAQPTQPATPTSPGTTQPVPPTTPRPGTTQPVPPATQTIPGTQQNQTRLSSADRKFINQAAEGGMAEVQLGQLALKRGSSDAVKQYAQQMIDEHTRVNEKLMAIATQKGVTPPKAIAPKHEKVRAKLSKLSGKSFDQAYMKEAGIKAHTEQAALFQRQAQQGQDPDLKAFAAQTLPAVQQHLQEAQAMTGSTSPSMMNSSPSPSPSPNQ
jgi:putative membrane protein